jgi:hypothetical protein
LQAWQNSLQPDFCEFWHGFLWFGNSRNTESISRCSCRDIAYSSQRCDHIVHVADGTPHLLLWAGKEPVVVGVHLHMIMLGAEVAVLLTFLATATISAARAFWG